MAAYIKNGGERSLETGRMYFKLSDIFYSYMSMWMREEENEFTQNMIKGCASQTFSYLANSLCALSATVNARHRETRNGLVRLANVRRELNHKPFNADSIFYSAHPVLAAYQTKLKRSGVWDNITSDTASVYVVTRNERKMCNIWEDVWNVYSLQELLMNNLNSNTNVSSEINLRRLEQTKKLYVRAPSVWFNDFAESLGNQSYFAIFMKQYAEAEQLANEGLAVDSTQHFIYSNLAAAFLFQGKYAEAEKIY